MKFKGLGVALITPFDQYLQVDYVALKKLITHLIENRADYLVILGTTGESATLSKDEKRKVVDTAIEVNQGRVPIVVGFGGNNTMQVTKDIETFNFESIDGILSVSPYYNKPSQEGIYEHYKYISAASPLPVMLYNVPGRTGSNISAETSLRLANDFDNIVAIKEASGNFDQIMQIIRHKPEGFEVISGDDALTLPLLSIGMDGVISVIGNAFTKDFSDMVRAYWDQDMTLAKQLHYKLLDYTNLCFAEGSPSGIKGLLHLLGICDVYVRPPLYKITDSLYQKFKGLLEQDGLL